MAKKKAETTVADIPKVSIQYRFKKNPTGFTNLAYHENVVIDREAKNNIDKETWDKLVDKGYIEEV